jgi:CTP synthase (UTP-ammonia lyase)
LQKKTPVLGTGDCFKILVEEFFSSKGFDQQREKIISDNLIEGNYFTGIILDQLSTEYTKLYTTKATTEYSSSRFSILPQYSEILSEGFEIGARNQFFDPEILKSKAHPYFVFTMFCPQIVSTKDLPHPIFTQFIKQAQKNKELNFSTQGGIKH